MRVALEEIPFLTSGPDPGSLSRVPFWRTTLSTTPPLPPFFNHVDHNSSASSGTALCLILNIRRRSILHSHSRTDEVSLPLPPPALSTPSLTSLFTLECRFDANSIKPHLSSILSSRLRTATWNKTDKEHNRSLSRSIAESVKGKMLGKPPHSPYIHERLITDKGMFVLVEIEPRGKVTHERK